MCYLVKLIYFHIVESSFGSQKPWDNHFFALLLGVNVVKKDVTNQAKNDMWTHPSLKTLQNINTNKTGKFGVCECFWSGDFCVRVREEKNKFFFAKMAFQMDICCKIPNKVFRYFTFYIEPVLFHMK